MYNGTVADRMNDTADQEACCTKTSADEKSVFVPRTTGLNSACDSCQVPDRNKLEKHAHFDISNLNTFTEYQPPRDVSIPKPSMCPPVATATAAVTTAIYEPEQPMEMHDPIRIPIRSVPYRPIVPVLCTSCSYAKSDPSCSNCSTGQKAMYTLSLDKQFLKALYWVRHAPPIAEQKLRDHSSRIEREALYYQITEGDITTPQPWAIQVEDREMWDARNKLRGMTKEQATIQYLRKVSEVEPHWLESAEIMCYTPIEENPLDSKML